MHEQCNHGRHCAKRHDATDDTKNKVINEKMQAEERLEIIKDNKKTATGQTPFTRRGN
jgi:hypothetical protein